MAKDPKKNVRKFKWYQRLIRWAVFVCVILVFAYATLPYWIPCGFLKNLIASDLQRQLRVPVSVGQVLVSWSNGLTLRDIVISDDPNFSQGSLVEVPEVRSDFSPWDFVVSRKIEWMQISGAKLAVRVNSDGQANTKIFDRLESDVQTLSTIVRDTTVTVDLPGSDELLVVKLADLQYHAGKIAGLGRLTLSAQLKQNGDPAAFSVQMDPGLEKDVLAAASFHFSGLDLEQLGLARMMGLELRKIAGRCSGSLDLQFDRASSQVGYFNCDLNIDQFEVQPLDETITIDVIERAGIRLSAAYDPYDPAGEKIDIKSMSVRLPGVDMTARGTVYSEIVGGNLKAVRNLDFDGMIEPSVIDDLLNLEPESPSQLSLDGPVRVKLKLEHKGPKLSLDMQADASDAVLAYSDRILKDSDIPLKISSQTILDERSRSLDVLDSIILFGSNTFTGSGTIKDIRVFSQTPSSELADLLKSVKWRGEMQLADFESIRKLAQPLGMDLSNVTFKGSAEGLVDIDPSREIAVQASVKVTPLSDFEITDVFVKPPSQAMGAFLRARFSNAPQVVMENLEMGMFVGEAKVSVDNSRLIRDKSGFGLNGDFEFKNTDQFLSCFKPQVAGVSGTADGTYSLLFSRDFQKIAIEADLTRMGLAIDEAFTKAPMDLAYLTVDMTHGSSMPSGRTCFGRLAWRCPSAELEAKVFCKVADDFESSPVKILLDGDISDAGWLKRSVTLLDRELNDTSVSGGLKLDGDIEWTPQQVKTDIRIEADKLEVKSADIDGPWWFDGCASVRGLIDAKGGTKKVSGFINAGKMEISAGDLFAKTASQRFVASVELEIPDSLESIRIRDFNAVCDNIKAQAGGTVFIDAAGEGKKFTSRMHVSVESPDVSILSKLFKPLEQYKPSGAILAEAQWDTRKADEIIYVTLQADAFGGYYNGRDVQANGDLTLRNITAQPDGKISVDAFQTDILSLRAGSDQVCISGQIESLMKSPRGWLQIAAGDIDAVALGYWVEGKQYDSTTQPVVEPYDEKSLIESARKQAQMLRDYLGGADITVDSKISSIRTWDQSVKYFYDTKQASLQATVRDAKIDLKYSGGVSGGSMCGGITIPLVADSDQVKFWKKLDDAYANDAIRAQMYKYFPGNKVKDLFTRRENGSTDIITFLANSSDPRYKLKQDGTALTIAVKGETAGRSAPKFVTKLLPGLNFTHYYYRKMTSFGREYSDGSAYSDMIFDGEKYDVYIEGTTDSNNIARYDVGVILLGSPQSAKWNHTWKQGRLPLFKVKAKIKDGKFEDMSISYPWPNESLGTIFIKNNIFYRAWLKSRGKANP